VCVCIADWFFFLLIKRDKVAGFSFGCCFFCLSILVGKTVTDFFLHLFPACYLLSRASGFEGLDDCEEERMCLGGGDLLRRRQDQSSCS
jgi:uncharacterized membrane protein YwzB